MIGSLEPQSLAQTFRGDAFHAVLLHSWLACPNPAASFWGVDADNAAVLHPATGFCLYNPAGRQMAEWARWVYQHRIALLAGELTTHLALMQQMAELDIPRPPACRFEVQDFCLLRRPQAGSDLARPATEQDLPRLATLYEVAAAEDMTPRPEALLRETLQRGKIWCLEAAGRIVAAALTFHESAQAGLVEGVFTLPDFRGQGLGRHCVAALCRQLQQEGRTPCLFYRQDNAAARALYAKMGFQPYGAWIISEMHY